jgi:hypothetical protein
MPLPLLGPPIEIVSSEEKEMRTLWVQVRTEIIANPGPPCIYQVRYDRCMRAVKMQSGKWLVRTWRQPFKTRLVGSLLMRMDKPRKEKKTKKSLAYISSSWIEAVKAETAKHSTFWSLYGLWKDAGMTPEQAFREARKEVRQAREWKRLLRDRKDPRKMNTECFFSRLKRRPRLFE